MKGRLLLSVVLALLCGAMPLLADTAPRLTAYRVQLVLAFGQAIQNHVKASGTVTINGAYRGANNLVTYHLNKASDRVVITDRKGNFVSAYKASERQIKDIVEGWGF